MNATLKDWIALSEVIYYCLSSISCGWSFLASVVKSGYRTCFQNIRRFQLHKFTVSIKELAEWFGLEVARIVVDECLPQRQN